MSILDGKVIAALRDGLPLQDERLEAKRNALEVVLDIGTYTMSTPANRMTEAPLDEQLKPFDWRSTSSTVDNVVHARAT